MGTESVNRCRFAFGPDLNRHGIQCSGIVETKAEAVRMVEETYQRCRIVTPGQA